MRKILAALSLTLALLGIVSVATPSVASAQTYAPCTQGESGGWWTHGNKLMQCISAGNHYLVRQWGNGGTVDEGIVLNFWLPGNLFFKLLWSGTDGSKSAVGFCGIISTVTNVNLVSPSGYAGWERTFQFQKSGVWYTEGVVNHFDGWAGEQAFGLVASPYACSHHGLWGTIQYLRAG